MKTLKQMKTQMQSQSGFTFIEILIAITVFSVGILGLITTTHTVSLNQRNADDTTEAAMIASDRMEEIKRLATNEPLGGIYGFTYVVDDQTGGFLNGFSAPNSYTRTLTDTIDIFSRTTQVMVFPPISSVTTTENFTTPDNIHMIELHVSVSWTSPTGDSKNLDLNTILQRRQFIQ
jgi:prepilin-type N-terminal cleavage/methylation domain-containing protein